MSNIVALNVLNGQRTRIKPESLMSFQKPFSNSKERHIGVAGLQASGAFWTSPAPNG
jgi:hypothetical protein